MKNLILLALFSPLFFTLTAEAQYPSCNPSTPKTPLDDYCPKLEGQTLERCCPDKVIQVRCAFHKEDTMRTAFMDTAGGNNCGTPSTPCCRHTDNEPCQSQVSITMQTVKVQYRNGCCSEPCKAPTGSGWVEGEIKDCSAGTNSCQANTISCVDVPAPPQCPGVGPNPPPPVNPPGNPPLPPSPPNPGGKG